MRSFTKKDNFVIATISIIIGIVGLSGYYAYFGSTDVQLASTPNIAGYTNVRGSTKPEYTPAQSTSTATREVSTTYINSDLGFTVKYPVATYGLNIPGIFGAIDVSAAGLAYDQCSTQMIAAHDVRFCPIRVIDHGAGMVQVNNEYITKQEDSYYSVKLSGQFKSAGTCTGVENCVDYGMIQKLFEQQILPTFTFIK